MTLYLPASDRRTVRREIMNLTDMSGSSSADRSRLSSCFFVFLKFDFCSLISVKTTDLEANLRNRSFYWYEIWACQLWRAHIRRPLCKMCLLVKRELIIRPGCCSALTSCSRIRRRGGWCWWSGKYWLSGWLLGRRAIRWYCQLTLSGRAGEAQHHNSIKRWPGEEMMNCQQSCCGCDEAA